MTRTARLRTRVPLSLVVLVLSVTVGVCLARWTTEARAAPPVCQSAMVRFTHDFSYIVGSSDYSDPDGDLESGSTFRWLVNGAPVAQGPVGELLLLHLDGDVSGCGGEAPLTAEGTAYEPGRWGSALALGPGGSVTFARDGDFDLAEGTIEMWVALRAAGDDPIYSSRAHRLFHYRAPNDDSVSITQSDEGVLYAGGSVGGQWQSAYNSRANMTWWPPGEWHHLAYTFSTSQNFMRFYVDGVLVADTNEGRYALPSDGGDAFVVGADVWGNEAHYLIDEVRIHDYAVPGEQITVRIQPEPYEAWLDTSQLQVSDSVVFEFTPSDGAATGMPCVSAPVVYPGIPITDPDPPSTILAPQTTEFTLTVHTITGTEVRYSLGEPLEFDAMTPFETGAGTTEHRTVVAPLDPDPNVTTRVFVRCAAYPDYILPLMYRSLSEANPSFPRTGNLWGSWDYCSDSLADCARIDLWLGASFSPDEIRELRRLNPDIRVLTSINAVENKDLPDDYYLKDINGNRVEVWPGSYRLNITKTYVAEYQAHLAARRILDSELMFDGCFFDNFMTTQSWQSTDIYGNPFPYDFDEDGVVDDPDALDAAWKAGVFHEIQTFRRLMPHALVSGHSMNIFEPGIAENFNGISIGFWTADVIERKREFDQLWERYEAWHTDAVPPHITMVESSPPDQIGYGYDYSPRDKIPASTLEFARTYYPYVRFGLAFTLMQDGYFAHEFGDTWHGNNWWYDELDFDLGRPVGPAEVVSLGADDPVNLIENGDFEEPIEPQWSFWVNTGEGCAATVSQDPADPAMGLMSARIDVTATCGEDWYIDFTQRDRSLIQDVPYALVFWAKADTDRDIRLSASRGSAPWENFGLSRNLAVTTGWEEYTVRFTANTTTGESRIQFMTGQTPGTVWLDDVRLYEQQPYVLQRRFTNGLVLLNPLTDPLEVEVGPGYRRLSGDQAPRVEYIVDDGDAAFSFSGDWTQVTYDSGEWQASGPFYHDWGEGCHESNDPQGEARWDLTIPHADTYLVTAWWPAAPSADTWSRSVLWEVVSGNDVLDSTTVDQSTGGDQWHPVAEVFLDPADAAFVRMRGQDGATCIADALHVRSAARYNDGSPASAVTLAPMDGIILAHVPEAGGSKKGCGCRIGSVQAGRSPTIALLVLVVFRITRRRRKRTNGRVHDTAATHRFPG